MKNFPMFLQMAGRRIIIFGGGEQAAQKTRLALKTEAELIFIADTLEPELEGVVASGKATHLQGPVSKELFENTALAFIATGCAAADASYAALAKAHGVLVNVVDRPDLCDAFTPAIVDRDPVVVAIGTEGTAPVLTRNIKTRLEEMLEPRLGELANLAGRLRPAVARLVEPSKRRALWRWVFNGAPRQNFAAGKEREASKLINDAIKAGGQVEAREGVVSLVGAGPGSRDLITLRGVQRLQEADIIFYDRLIDPGLLELARRDAERVFVGKTPGTTAWPQSRINKLIVAAAQKGQRVVRLKCGDPGVFARGAQEAEALQKAGIEWEIVPGVTAAAAAAASIDSFLTERGNIDTLVFSTGQTQVEGEFPNWAHHLRPGTTLALYMAVSKAADVQNQILRQGYCADLPVEIVSKAASADQKVLQTTVGTMAQDIKRDGIQNPAIIFIRNRKTETRIQIENLSCDQPVVALAG